MSQKQRCPSIAGKRCRIRLGWCAQPIIHRFFISRVPGDVNRHALDLRAKLAQDVAHLDLLRSNPILKAGAARRDLHLMAWAGQPNEDTQLIVALARGLSLRMASPLGLGPGPRACQITGLAFFIVSIVSTIISHCSLIWSATVTCVCLIFENCSTTSATAAAIAVFVAVIVVSSWEVAWVLPRSRRAGSWGALCVHGGHLFVESCVDVLSSQKKNVAFYSKYIHN